MTQPSPVMVLLLGNAWNTLLSSISPSPSSPVSSLMLTDSDLHSLIGVLDNDNDDNDDDGGGGGGGERYRFDPSDLWPLPLSFGALTVLWTALLVLWIGHIVYYRRKYSFGLHRLLCVLPVAKMLSLVLGLVYYRDCVAHGVVGDGMSCRIRWTYFLYDLSDMVFLVAIFHVLFLLSKGYSITRNHFEEQERKAMLWNLSCIAICRIAYSMSNYFVFPMVVMSVVLFGHVFSGIVLNVRMLWAHLIYYRDSFAQQHPESMAELQRRQIDITKDNPAIRKLELFRRLQYLISFGVSLLFLVFVANMIIALQQSPSLHRLWVWLSPLSFEIMYLVVAALILFVFRLRDFSKYALFNVVSQQNVETQEIEIVVDNQETRERHEQEMEQQPLLLNLATMPPARHKQRSTSESSRQTSQASSSSDHSSSVIVIQNPTCYEPHAGQRRPPAQRAQQVKVFVALQPEEPPTIEG